MDILANSWIYSLGVIVMYNDFFKDRYCLLPCRYFTLISYVRYQMWDLI